MSHKFIGLIFFCFLTSRGFSQSSIFVGDNGKAAIEQYDLDGNFISLIDDDINTPRGMTSDDFLLFGLNKDDGQLIRYDILTGDKTVLIDQLDDPRDLIAVKGEDFLIFTEYGGSLSRINYDGSDYNTITNLIPTPLFLSYDPLVKKVFVTNRLSIYSVNYDGTDLQVLPGNYDDPVAIEVDPRTSSLYFSERGLTNHLSKMKYDGSQREVLLDTLILFTFLDFDCTSDRMYFTSGTSNAIGSFELDGSDMIFYEIEQIGVSSINLFPANCDQLSSTETNEISKLSIYPNPTTGLVYLENCSDFYKIELLDFYGKVIKRFDNSKASCKIDLNLNAGSYLLRCYSKDFIVIQQVVKI